MPAKSRCAGPPPMCPSPATQSMEMTATPPSRTQRGFQPGEQPGWVPACRPPSQVRAPLELAGTHCPSPPQGPQQSHIPCGSHRSAVLPTSPTAPSRCLVTTRETTAAHSPGSPDQVGCPRPSRFGPVTCSMQTTGGTTLDSFNLPYPSTQATSGTTRNSLDLLDPSYPCILVFLVRNTPAPHSLCYGLHCTPQDVSFQS